MISKSHIRAEMRQLKKKELKILYNSKNSNVSSPKTSLLFVTGAMAVVVFMTSFTVIAPGTAQTAPVVVLTTGQWEIHENGYVGTLTIDNVGADGIVTGRLQVSPNPPHTITGLYNERTGNLTFYRIINQILFKVSHNIVLN